MSRADHKLVKAVEGHHRILRYCEITLRTSGKHPYYYNETSGGQQFEQGQAPLAVGEVGGVITALAVPQDRQHPLAIERPFGQDAAQ